MAKFYQNPFYDSVFGNLNTIIPSKRIGYKVDLATRNIVELNIPNGIIYFEEYIKSTYFKNPLPGWPFKGRLLVVISVGLIPSEYRARDVDGFAKTLLDSLKGIAYLDDRQVDALYSVKRQSSSNGFMIGIKKLSEQEGWYLPELYSETPYPHSTNVHQ